MSNLENPSSETARVDVRPVINRTKLGFWFFLGGEVILFGTLILTYAILRIDNASVYAPFRSHLSIPLIGINTLLLITSSYFVVRSLEASRKGLRSAMQWNLVVALLLGSVFIGGQAYEWSTLFGEGIRLSNTFGAPFYIITGIHGTHVLIGLAWASIVLFLGPDRTFNSHRSGGLEFFGLYWHFVDIVWIVLFSLIYLL